MRFINCSAGFVTVTLLTGVDKIKICLLVCRKVWILSIGFVQVYVHLFLALNLIYTFDRRAGGKPILDAVNTHRDYPILYNMYIVAIRLIGCCCSKRQHGLHLSVFHSVIGRGCSVRNTLWLSLENKQQSICHGILL